MIEINPSQMTPTFKALFRTNEPQAKRCFTVLEGRTPGRMLTNDPTNPTWGVVQEGYDNCIYLGGIFDAPTIAGVIDQLRQKGDVHIGLWPDDPRFDLIPLPTLYGHWVLEFYDRPIGKGLDAYLNGVPAGCAVRRMDRDLIMRSEWGPGDVVYAGGIEAWEATCLGYCLLGDNEILAEATVGPGALGLREPGVITQAAHRGKGYGTIVTAHLIHAIEALGERTYWNCTENNLASAGIARKLGYQVKKAYRLWGWAGEER